MRAWRKIKSHSPYLKYIRKICYSMLILELAFMIRESDQGSWFAVRHEETDSWEQKTEQEIADEESYEKTYGFELRLKEGLLNFYRIEERKEGFIRKNYE
ncbi:MAG: hypothetical protein RR466_07825 [Hungatella sp.]